MTTNMITVSLAPQSNPRKLLKLSQAARLIAHKAVNGRYQTKMVSSQSPSFPKPVYSSSILE